MKEALAIAEDAMPEIIQTMVARARDPNHKDSQRAAEYLCDRIYGKPNQSIEGQLKHKITRVVKVKDYGN